jgi:hypothetical protein
VLLAKRGRDGRLDLVDLGVVLRQEALVRHAHKVEEEGGLARAGLLLRGVLGRAHQAIVLRRRSSSVVVGGEEATGEGGGRR